MVAGNCLKSLPWEIAHCASVDVSHNNIGRFPGTLLGKRGKRDGRLMLAVNQGELIEKEDKVKEEVVETEVLLD